MRKIYVTYKSTDRSIHSVFLNINGKINYQTVQDALMNSISDKERYNIDHIISWSIEE